MIFSGINFEILVPSDKLDNPMLRTCRTKSNKTGYNTFLNNYRHISILPGISKVLEKLVCNILVGFLEDNDILYKHQYGFR